MDESIFVDFPLSHQFYLDFGDDSLHWESGKPSEGNPIFEGGEVFEENEPIASGTGNLLHSEPGTLLKPPEPLGFSALEDNPFPETISGDVFLPFLHLKEEERYQTLAVDEEDPFFFPFPPPLPFSSPLSSLPLPLPSPSASSPSTSPVPPTLLSLSTATSLPEETPLSPLKYKIFSYFLHPHQKDLKASNAREALGKAILKRGRKGFFFSFVVKDFPRTKRTLRTKGGKLTMGRYETHLSKHLADCDLSLQAANRLAEEEKVVKTFLNGLTPNERKNGTAFNSKKAREKVFFIQEDQICDLEDRAEQSEFC